MIRCWLLSCLLLAYTARAQRARIDLSSVDAYWQLTDTLRQDRPVSDALWATFTSLPATQLTVAGRGLDLNVLRQALDIVYRPTQEPVQRALLTDSSGSFALKRYYVQLHSKYERQRPALEAFAQQARNSQLLSAAYQLTYQVLPATFRQTKRTVPNLVIYYSPLFEGGYAEGNRIILTLETEYAFRQQKPNQILAHELHHLLRPTARLRGRTPTDQRLLDALGKLLDEGSADLVGVTSALYKTVKPAVSVSNVAGDDPFLWYLPGADTAVAHLNTCLTRYAQTGDTTWISPERLNVLLVESGGHVPSGFMGHVIDRAGLRPQLLRQLSNPFAFVRLYQQAARQDPSRPPQFSLATLALISRLEKRYWLRR